MKFKANKHNFMRGLSRVKSAYDGRQSLPILKGVLIDSSCGVVELSLTNLDMIVKARFDVSTINYVAGRTVVDYSRLSAVVSSMPDGEIAVCVKTVGKREVMEVISGKCRSTLATMPPEEWPTIADVEDGKTVELEAGDIMLAFNSTVHAVSDNDTRKVLKCSLVEIAGDGKIVVVGTDGTRLAACGEFCAKKPKVTEAVVPGKLVGAIVDAVKGESGSFKFVTDGKMILVEAAEKPKWTVQGRLMDEVFPNWRQVILWKMTESLTVDRNELCDNFTRALNANQVAGEHPCVKMNIGHGVIEIDANGEDCEMHTEMPVKYDGDGTVILLNPKKVIQALNAAVDDELTMHFTDGHSPIMFKGESGTTEVIMPIRVSY